MIHQAGLARSATGKTPQGHGTRLSRPSRTSIKAGQEPLSLTHFSSLLLLRSQQQGETQGPASSSPAPLTCLFQHPHPQQPSHLLTDPQHLPHSLTLLHQHPSHPQNPALPHSPLFQGPSTPHPWPATTSADPADPPRSPTAATSPVPCNARTLVSSSTLPL